MRFLSLLLVSALLLGFSSCTNTTEYQADQLTVSEVSGQPGFAWFSQEVGRYTPNAADVAAIRSAYAAAPFTTYMYVNQACTCSGTLLHFPRLYSTLKAAGVPDSSMVVFNMLNAATPHPYADKYPVRVLPTFYFVRGASNDFRRVEPPTDTLTRIDSLVAFTLK
ncbi:MAG: hypothetical protein ACK45R_09505 [Candidatus Kapaibacterium sp.]|jgi:hypothetical protein